MKKLTLAAELRKITGKKVKNLRKQGLLPANVFGKNIKSVSIQIPISNFLKTYEEVGETGLIDLVLNNEPRPVLIQNTQMHPLTQLPLHADFYQVNLKEKVKARVPLELIGVAIAVSQKTGVLLQIINEVEVEALPTELPEKIDVDVSKMEKVGDTIKISDLRLAKDVTCLAQADTDVVKIGELITKEAEQMVQEEAAAAAAVGDIPVPTATGSSSSASTEDIAPPNKDMVES